MPQLSVLMPCYNAAQTVTEALESLAQQSFTDFEVISIDDGSTDETLQILQAWSERDGRFCCFSQPHGGIIAALNAGMDSCRAPLVARMDADDHCHPQRFEKQVAYLEAHPQIAVLGCQVAGFPPQAVREGFRIYISWQNALLSDADIRREMFVESPLSHPSVVFRREWLERVGGYQEHGWAEDYDLWLRLYLAEARFAKLPEILLEWRESPLRLTRIDSRYSVENFLRAKATYLMRGPLLNRDAVFIWGAGMMGRRLGKQLGRLGVPLAAFIDIDPKKIGRTRRGLPVLSTNQLMDWWGRFSSPVLLAAVGARGARQLIRQQLTGMGLREGIDWWGAA